MADYRPIEDYGIIGDCRTAALISREGSIDWLCLPNFHSSSVFARLLDAKVGGYFSVRPTVPYESRQSYVDGNSILKTDFHTPHGSVRLLDFMPITQSETQKSRFLPLRQVVRIIEGLSGVLELEVDYQPRTYYASQKSRVKARSPHNHVLEGKGWQMQLLSERPLSHSESGAYGRLSISEGERVTISLGYDEDGPAVYPAVGQEALDLLRETIEFWRSWLEVCSYDGPYQGSVKRSALALKLMEFAPSGAIIAAPTTSLPEKIGGSLNWDYRFCWLRDAAFTLEALQGIGFRQEAQAFLDWLLHSTRVTHPQLSVVYDIYGKDRLPPQELDHLEGYRQSGPVRIGNRASQQYQLDVYGEVLDGLFRTNPQKCQGSRDVRNLVSGAADYVSEHWPEPDNGIWEMEQKGQFTHSKALCWLALDRAVNLMQETGASRKRIKKWQEARDRVSRVVLEQGYSPKARAFTQKLGQQELDASLLPLPIHGLIDPYDSRMLSTTKAVRDRLVVNGLVYRYDQGEGQLPDEGAFLICNFWLAHCLALQGDLDSAHQAFQAGLKCANHLGLMSEEAHPYTLEALGNFPQGLTHIGLINAVLAIQQAET